MLCITINLAGCATFIEAGNTNTPDGVVVLVVDGLGNGYINPELDIKAIDDSVLKKPCLSNLPEIYNQAAIFDSVYVPELKGNSGHNVIITGNRDADDTMVGYDNASIYDVVRKHGYLTIGIFERGDSEEVVAENDIVLHDTTNSINEPVMQVEISGNKDMNVLPLLKKEFESHASQALSRVESTPSGTIQRYYTYNKLAIDAAMDSISILENEDRDTKYFMTVNIAALETAGIYRGYEGYSQCIENLDSMIVPLYKKCQENNLALVITSDHGMAFPDAEARGGAKSDKYASANEVRNVPLIILSPNIKQQRIQETIGQEDVAPILLSTLGIPERPSFCEGKEKNLKESAAIKVMSPSITSMKLSSSGEEVCSGSNDSVYYITGLEKNKQYTLETVIDSSGKTYKETLSIENERVIEIKEKDENQDSTTSPENNMHLVGGILIGVINLTGLTMIFRIMRN
ncbi:sulfatase-like hydrolase/transferase [Methanohalophilus mahii]|uniref:Metalloenzyme domain protein n=1 Tax=Methanohalophilus mahii (strain ATCC 35705 / DSM 5219 / SLP) TaxID=547558 RepID=D5EBD8_METMS|nr:sulfatase-like hydrolase/transferase [Methanohalophilus mahii]ADE36489.1 metalloenzyme domain protein [Methanohalophilus mahii DSM 5219]